MNRREINKSIRRVSKSNKKDCSCYICQSKDKVQEHHLISVENLTHIAYHNGYDNEDKIKELYMPTEYLCQECHNLMHNLQEENYNETVVDLDAMYGVVGLMEHIDIEKAPEELKEDYQEVYDDMLNNIVYSFVKNNDLTEEELDEVIDLVDLSLGNKYTDIIYDEITKGDDVDDKQELD